MHKWAGAASRLLVLIVTPLALELSTTITTRSPRLLGTNGKKSATLAFVRANVVFKMIIDFLTRVTIVAACKNPSHLGDDVIVIVVVVEVNLLVFLRTGVDDIILILFGHDIDLVFGQVRLKQFGLLDSARLERHAGILGKFPCQTRLHRPTIYIYIC